MLQDHKKNENIVQKIRTIALTIIIANLFDWINVTRDIYLYQYKSAHKNPVTRICLVIVG